MDLDLHITDACNLRCKHCMVEANADNRNSWDILSLNKIQGLMEDLKELNVNEIRLTGGEPLLNPEFFDILNLLKLNGFKVQTQTNGLDSIFLSLDGLKDSHNDFRGNNFSFDSVIKAIKLFIKFGMKVRVNTVIHKKNIPDLLELINLSKELGVDMHSFYSLGPIGRGKNLINDILSFEEWENTTKTIREHVQKIDFSSHVMYQDVFSNSFTISSCHINSREKCIILSNGDVYTCVYFLHSPYSLGNVFNEGLKNIWFNSKKWNKLSNIPKKTNCDKDCMGGCKGYSLIMLNDIEMCDPRCREKEHVFPRCCREYIYL